MKKMILVFAPLLCMALFSACSKKVYTTAPVTSGVVNPSDYLPFTKSLKFRLEQDRADIKKVQFYTDKPIILRRTAPSASGVINQGTITYDNVQDVTEITIPAYTPGVCERVKGDSLYISFDAPQNAFVFSAIYANENFMLQGSNWYNGTVDVNYDGNVYKAECDGCGSAGEVMLMIRRPHSSMKTNNGNGKIVSGRKLN